MLTVQGYQFYGTVPQTQVMLIQQLNSINPPIAEVSHGMCFMLSLQWVNDCLSAPAGTTPENTFDSITLPGGFSYLRELAGNHRAYATQQFNPDTLDDDVAACLGVISQGHRQSAKHFSYLMNDLSQVAAPGPNAGHLIAVYAKRSDNKWIGHAIGEVIFGGQHYFYDPNYGVYHTADPLDFYGGVLPNLYGQDGTWLSENGDTVRFSAQDILGNVYEIQ